MLWRKRRKQMTSCQSLIRKVFTQCSFASSGKSNRIMYFFLSFLFCVYPANRSAIWLVEWRIELTRKSRGICAAVSDSAFTSAFYQPHLWETFTTPLQFICLEAGSYRAMVVDLYSKSEGASLLIARENIVRSLIVARSDERQPFLKLSRTL